MSAITSRNLFKAGSPLANLKTSQEREAAIVALLRSHCDDLKKLEATLNLPAVREAIEEKLHQLRDAELWCSVEEVESMRRASVRIAAILTIVESISACLEPHGKL